MMTIWAGVPCYVVDPKEVPVSRKVTFIKEVATKGVTELVNKLMQ